MISKLLFIHLMWIMLIKNSECIAGSNHNCNTCVLPESTKVDLNQVVGNFNQLLEAQIAEMTRVMLYNLDANIKKLEAKFTQNCGEPNSNIDESFLKSKPGNSPINKEQPQDCWDILVSGKNTSGVYSIYPGSRETKVLCDMDSDGGGWTVFLLRKKQPTQENFSRTWNEYMNGFGTPPDEYWIGNEVLHQLTSSRIFTMRADAEIEGDTGWGEWTNFNVQSAFRKYRLTITGYNTSSTLLDSQSFGYNNGLEFTTQDQDNDNWINNCGEYFGGFWHDGSRSSVCSFVYATRSYGRILFGMWSKSVRSKNAHTLTLKIRPTNRNN